MSPVLYAFLGSILRHLLVGASVYFVSHGYFTQAESLNYVAAFITFALGFGWSLWQKYAASVQEAMAQETAYFWKELYKKQQQQQDQGNSTKVPPSSVSSSGGSNAS